jgi:glycosyltransferase involved in cell wall biosynthesis
LARTEKVLYLAAHGGFGSEAVPLGGGAAIFNLLVKHWAGTAPFELETVTPAELGASAPAARQIVGYNERQYARFCDAFREAATRRVLQEDPARVAVLVNDVSEGPDFALLANAGYRLLTIYHVDVVAYIASIYLRGRVRARSLTRWWRTLEAAGLDRVSPRILRLIFANQAASVRHSRGVVVPSRGMKATLLECYPELEPGRVHVLPWGAPPGECSAGEAAEEAQRLRVEYGVEPDATVLLALSRISPEKGHDLLLDALLHWEARGGPPRPVWLFVCGEAAFMRGEAYMARLRRLAGRLRRVRAVFPGYVTGVRKAGFHKLADLYVFPSRHESYGLTLMEAMREGLASIALDHDGSRESLPAGCGVVISREDSRGLIPALSAELERLAGDRECRVKLGLAAARHAGSRPLAAAADDLARMLGELS